MSGLPSILFDRAEDRLRAQHATMPEFFTDLNLDQVVDAVTASWAEYDLKPFFYFPLSRIETIRYRHEVFQDLENAALLADVRSFAQRMRDVRAQLRQAGKLHYHHQKHAWFMYAVETYCQAVKSFAKALSSAPLRSRGFLAFGEYLARYARGGAFTSLLDETSTLERDLAAVRYCVLIRDGAFTVRNYHEESDYSAEIEATFLKFKQGAPRDYLVNYRSSADMNHIEAKILEFVALLNPDLFARLDDYCRRHADFIEKAIAAFDRELHFYVAYIDHAAKFRHAGLPFCYPDVSNTSKAIFVREGFDLALAQKLTDVKATIVCNDFFLKGKERIIVVTGPNQGGKTTFGRMFGQLHYLAGLGCPAPGREGRMFLFDRLFTHFEREEKVENLRGKLEDDLARIRAILDEVTPRSIVVLNEIFTSTTLDDELFLSKKTMEELVELDLLCVWVTFVDELSFGEKIVSMVSTVVPENPALRTFRIVRRLADGLAYAMAIAEKYRLTYASVKERIAP